MVEQDENESSDSLIDDIDKDKVQLMSDEDIDTRLELLEVKLQ